MHIPTSRRLILLAFTLILGGGPVLALEVGFATRDISPSEPIWLAGYAARRKPSERVDQALKVSAAAFRDEQNNRFILIGLDNCEVSQAFMAPVLKASQKKHSLPEGAIMVVSSHTHSAPVLADVLDGMFDMPEADRERVRQYSRILKTKMLEAIDASLSDLQPALLEYGVGSARFAMNRRIYRDTGVAFGDNPEGPVNWDVPVLKVVNSNQVVRGILFGYACHGTSIRTEDFFAVSGDYMGYTRDHLESLYPGATAIYLTGMGADADPAPRGNLLVAKRHGLELAGSVVSVLHRPMRRVDGPLKLQFERVNLALEGPPAEAVLRADAQSQEVSVRKRAQKYLELAQAGQAPPSVSLPISVFRIGNSLAFISMGGEVVADYGLKLRRLYAQDNPWLIGYAYEVPCYIPSIRVIKEGGYEAVSSLAYYGYYGPFKPAIETVIYGKIEEMMQKTR